MSDPGSEGPPKPEAKRLAHYELLAPIGAGGMGVVYRARDKRLNRIVAIKLVTERERAEPAARSRLLSEARLAASLSHTNICTYFEVREADGESFLVMELIEGTTLREQLRPNGLPVESVLRLGAQLAAGLAHAHEHNVLHRDLKSVNIMVTPEGLLKILDFGLARVITPDVLEDATTSRLTLRETDELAGTLPYMAPEILSGGHPSPHCDIWSMGVVLHEMVTGSLPFPGATGAEISGRILRAAPAPLPADTPPALRALIDRCLAKDPTQRYGQAREVTSALETAHASFPVSGPLEPGELQAQRPGTRVRWFGAVAAIVAAATLWWAVSRPDLPAGRSLAEPVVAVLAVESDVQTEGVDIPGFVSDALVNALASSPETRVISTERLLELRRDAELEGLESGTRASAQRLARRAGVTIYFSARLRSVGGQLVMTVSAVTPESGEILWTHEERLADTDLASALLQLVDSSSTAARVWMIGDTPAAAWSVAQSLTPSLEAHVEYYNGLRAGTEGQWDAARGYFEAATRIDQGFARAYAAEARAYEAVNDHERAIGAGRMALERRDRLGEQWARFVGARLLRHQLATRDGDLAAATAALESLVRDYPRWPEARLELGELQFHTLQFDAASTTFAELIELEPGNADYYRHYIGLLRAQGQIDEARMQLARLLEVTPDGRLARVLSAAVEIGAREYATARSHLQVVLSASPDDAAAHDLWAQTLMLEDSPQAALEYLEGLPSTPGSSLEYLRAGLLYRLGRSREAREVVATRWPSSSDSQRLVSRRTLATIAIMDERFADADALLEEMRELLESTPSAGYGQRGEFHITAALRFSRAGEWQRLGEVLDTWQQQIDAVDQFEEAEALLELFRGVQAIERGDTAAGEALIDSALRGTGNVYWYSVAAIEAARQRLASGSLEGIDSLVGNAIIPASYGYVSESHWVFPEAMLIDLQVRRERGDEAGAAALAARLRELWRYADPGWPYLAGFSSQ